MLEDFVNLWSKPDQFEWQLLAVIAIAIAFSFSAIAYMFSRFIGSEQLVRWAKKEFLYAVSSALFISLLLVTSVAISNIMIKFSLETMKQSIPVVYAQVKDKGIDDPYFLVKVYLDRIGACARKEYVWLSCLSIVPFVIHGTDIGNIASGPFSTTPSTLFVNSINSASYSITYMLFTLYLQKHFVLFLQSVMLTVFLPAGIVLRAFPSTRGIGSAFIALSIGFYIIYPMGYAMMLVVSPEQPFNTKTFCGITDPNESFIGYTECSKDAFGGAGIGIAAAAAKFFSLTSKLLGPLKAILPPAVLETGFAGLVTGGFMAGLYS